MSDIQRMGDAEVSISLVAGYPLVDSKDISNAFKVAAMISMKLNRSDALDPNSIYAKLAQKIVERAESENWTVGDLEKAIDDYLFTKQYGERVEPADFICNHKPERFYPYSWLKNEVHHGRTSYFDWDGYMLDDIEKIMWRKHDGKKLDFGELRVFAGKPVEQPRQLESVNPGQRDGQEQKSGADSKESSKNDDLLNAATIENAKLNIKILENKDVISKLDRKIESLQNDNESYLKTISLQSSDLMFQQKYIESLQTFIEQNGMKEIFLKQMEEENEGS